MACTLFHDRYFEEKPPFDTAQICLNGHCVTPMFEDHPEYHEKFCRRCGEATITACQKCQASIRGYNRYSNVIAPYAIPAFCHNCGTSFPWTERALTAAKDFADGLDSLSADQRTALVAAFKDIVRETPQTPVSANRIRTILAKAGSFASDTFRKILIDLASETAKKIIWPDSH